MVEQQPARRRIAPGLAIQPGVLLEVGDLPPRRVLRTCLAAPAALLDQALSLGGNLVGIDLVAQQQQGIGPLMRRLRPQPLDQSYERINLATAVVAVLAQRVRWLVRHSDPARPEDQAQRLAGRARADDARGEELSASGQQRSPSRWTS